MSLKDRALEIKTETTIGANTAPRVGGLLEDILENSPLMGFFDYNNNGASQSYTNGDLILFNNGLGSFTNKTYKPEGINDIYNTTTNRFDFTNLSLGDTVFIRLDLNLDASNNQVVNCRLNLGEGANAYYIPFVSDRYYKTTGNKRIVEFNGIYMGDNNTKDNPAYFSFSSDNPATITVNGWYVEILKKSKVSG
jgi:hypothetical protein